MTFNDDANLDTSQITGGSGGVGRVLATGGGGGIGLLVIYVIFNLFFGGGANLPIDPGQVLAPQSGGSGGDSVAQVDVSMCKTGADANKHDECLVVGTVNSVQDYWQSALPADANRNYHEAKTVLFSGQTQSACGPASRDSGPFYCPVDERVYIDASFYQELSSRFGADKGQFAKEYVLAHEYGHHIENILGYLQKAQSDRSTGPDSGSVHIELMADCLAGVWGNHASTTKDANGTTLIEPLTDADIKSALSAAWAVGDDHIQETLGGGAVNPESWTHGSSQQREKAFMTGYKGGSISACETYAP